MFVAGLRLPWIISARQPLFDGRNETVIVSVASFRDSWYGDTYKLPGIDRLPGIFLNRG